MRHASAKAALEAVAEAADLTLNALIRGARVYVEQNEYMVDGGRWEGFSIPDDFWEHYQMYTGEAVEEENRNNFFSCSC